MKKLISVLLCAAMIMSCAVSAFADNSLSNLVGDYDYAQALENFNGDSMNLPSGEDDYDLDIEAMLQSGALDELNLFGLTVDFLYNSKEQLFWSTVAIDKQDLTLARGNLNVYLQRVMKDYCDKDSFYNAKNATAIANFIGHLINPDYQDKNVIFTISYVPHDDFYNAIVEYSGLGAVIEANWVNQSSYYINFKPVLHTFGVNLEKFLERDFEDPQFIGRMLVSSVIEKAMEEGPINYTLNVLQRLSRAYGLSLRTPIVSLFKGPIQRGIVEQSEFDTIRGFLNYIFNRCNPDDASALQFITFPVYRFAASRDLAESFLYLLVYLNLVGKYKQNANAVNEIKQAISRSSISQTDKDRIGTLFDGVFLGKLGSVVPLIVELSSENITAVTDNAWNSWLNFLSGLLENITKWFDMMYQSIRKIIRGDFA